MSNPSDVDFIRIGDLADRVVIDWAFGFFPLLTMMVMVIMGLLAARFVHVDKHYEQVLIAYNSFIRNTYSILMTEENPIDPAIKKDMLYHIRLAQWKYDRYQNYRNDNQNSGALADGIAIAALIVLGMIAVLIDGREHVVVFVIFSIMIFAVPPLHFAYHKNVMRKAMYDVSKLNQP